MTIDWGWNARNSQIPFPRYPPLGWNVRNGRERVKPHSIQEGLLHLFHRRWIFANWSFKKLSHQSFIWSWCLGQITSDWVLLAPNWPVRRRRRPITNCNHLPFSTSSTPPCTTICNTSSCPTVIKCLIDDSTATFLSQKPLSVLDLFTRKEQIVVHRKLLLPLAQSQDMCALESPNECWVKLIESELITSTQNKIIWCAEV